MSHSSSRNVSLAETKSRLAECVRAAERGENVVITRHGKPVAALVSTQDLALISRLRAAKQGKGLAALAGGWAGSAELVEHALTRRRTSRRRTRE
ncbi:MAG: type II toxin-antitoxin system prevent-host-death family antitoxin [Polyangiaceae bacterium]|nr:type II toxin-antitoxin system prevent-host-death family antitoxin [Polyangiaceae bacterium]